MTCKRARMAPYGAELDRSAISYEPFIISCWGRLHPEAIRMLRSIAKVRARREQSTGAETLYRQLLARVTALVWRRAARMALRCRPHSAGDDPLTDFVVPDDICYLRAGLPGTVDLPPLEPPSPVAPGPVSGPPPSGG